MPSPDEIWQNLRKDFEELQKLLNERAIKIRQLEEEKNNLRGQLRVNEEEHQKELADLEGKINELVKEIESLIGSSPAYIGTLIMPTKDGWALMLDNHKTVWEVKLSTEISREELEEGSEVKYVADPITGRPLSIFDIRQIRRSEEKAVVEEMLDERTAWITLPGDVHQLANIGWKITGLEKGDEVYYYPAINFITGKISKIKEKIDLSKIEKKTYKDIGGLREQIKKVREVIELPLKHPEVYEQLGIRPLKGILLTGQPGCGKTLIGKAVAHESQAFYIYVRGPEFLSPYIGESVARLRAIFDTARRNAPAIIFFDELESVASERDEVQHAHDRQVVAQLLSLMDGLIPQEKVVVIAATNKPELLDEAFRRPGRFDREIVIPVPDRSGRMEILKIYTKLMPLASGVSLESLADETHGFTGADIEALCKEAALHVLENADLENIGKGSAKKIEVKQEDFKLVLTTMKPSTMRQIVFQKPAETWNDIGGLEDIKQKLEEAVKWPLLYPELMRIAKQDPVKGILLWGPPGCGKTSIARALANECGINFIPVKAAEFLHELVGRSERNVREVFKRARQSAPCIIFFDEIDAMASRRSSEVYDSGVGNRVTSQLLNELDGIEEARGIFVLAATNRLDLIDSALMRPGRLKPFYIPLPEKEAREKIFLIHTKGKPLAKDVDLKVLAEKAKLPPGTVVSYMAQGQLVKAELSTDLPFSGAEIENICREAVQKALREFVDKRDPKKDYKDFEISMKHFEKALEEILQISVKKEGTSAEALKTVRQLTDEDLKKVT